MLQVNITSLLVCYFSHCILDNYGKIGRYSIVAYMVIGGVMMMMMINGGPYSFHDFALLTA